MSMCYSVAMTTAIYIRVSSKTQKHDSQRAEITAWLIAHGHDPDHVQWFEDTDTGRHISRSGMIALNEAIFAGDVKTIIVWKLDRIARTMKDGINTLSHWCEIGVRVVSVTQQIDLSGTVGHLVAGVLFAVAEIELQHMRERQTAGIEAAKAKGVYKGRSRNTTKGNPERARALRAKGLKTKEIAQAMNITTRTVSRYLKAETT